MSHHQPNQTFYLDQSTLQCKAGCGFFGNPEWFGYCSICFKQLNSHNQHNNNRHRAHQSRPHQYHHQPIQQSQSFQYQQPLTQQMIQQQQQQQQQQQELLYRQQEQHRRYQEQQRLYFLQSQQQRDELARRQQDQLQKDIKALQRPFQRNPSPNSFVPGESNATSVTSNEAPADISSTDDHQQRQTPSAISTNLTPTPEHDDTQSAMGSSSTLSGATTTSGNLFSQITSPTAIVQMGYDTLSNLHQTIMNTAKSSFRASPSASADVSSIGDSLSIHSTSQSEYQVGRRSSARRQWTSIINPSTSGRKASLAEGYANFHYDMAWVDCLNHTNKFAREILSAERKPDKTINDLSDMIHEFYENMAKRFDGQLIYKGATQDQLELLNDNMERILNEHIYHVISARIINEDEDHNMAIQKRIRSLNWITVEHLEIEIDFQRPVVHDLLDKAICQMVEMNSRTSSIDKLECIVQCSKTIFELLQVGQPNIKNSHNSINSNSDGGDADTSNCLKSSDMTKMRDLTLSQTGDDGSTKEEGDKNKRNDINDDDEDQDIPKRKHIPASADQFLPVLVFVVIQANPPMLPADMKYLTRFSNPRRLMSGETGYYFTNLCCALEFIEKASGASLNISEEEFNKYINGEAVPETKSHFHTYLSDGLRTMCSNDAALKKLKQRQDTRLIKIDQLSEQIDVHMETNRAKLTEMENFAADLEKKLIPRLPDFYEKLKESDVNLANRLWPSILRRTDT